MRYWVARARPGLNEPFEDWLIPKRIGRWWTKRPPRTWDIGDRLFIWASSPQQQIIALGELRGLQTVPDKEGFYRYRVRYLTGVLQQPVKRATLSGDPVLNKSILLKYGPSTSVVRLTDDEGEQLYSLVIAQNPEANSVWPDLLGRKNRQTPASSVREEILELVNPEEVCHSLVPSEYWDDVMEALGRSIELVHKSGPKRWGVRLAPDSIMLKIGPHEVLQIHSRERQRPFHLIIDKNSVPSELRARPELWFSDDQNCYGKPGTASYYASNAGSEACDMSFKSVRDIYPALLNAHTNIVARAATKRRHASIPRTHSPVLVRFVAQTLGRPLPQPVYCDTFYDNSLSLTAEEVRSNEKFAEGAARQILVNAYERDRRARQRCIEHYGARCAICHISFEERYGPEAAGIIHVHHVIPLSEIGERYEVDPIKDLLPVCPNCHTVIHATKQARTVKRVAEMIRGSQQPRP